MARAATKQIAVPIVTKTCDADDDGGAVVDDDDDGGAVVDDDDGGADVDHDDGHGDGVWECDGMVLWKGMLNGNFGGLLPA